MPVKIEGLCGVTVKENVLYALLPNCNTNADSAIKPGNQLYRHYPAILLEYTTLTPDSQRHFLNDHIVEKSYLLEDEMDTRHYGRIVPNYEEVRFTLNGEFPLQVNNVNTSFVEMKKVNTNEPALLEQELLTIELPNSRRYRVDLICRVIIDKGVLRAMEPSNYKYSFSDPTQINQITFCSILHVEANVTEVQIGSRRYSFQEGTNPIIGIENLPIGRPQLNNGDIDYDFELSYKLVPNVQIKSLPRVYEVLPDRPIICPIPWFEVEK